METIKLNYGDILICDCGYIKEVSCEWNGEKELRFDGLKLIKVLHEGDDGVYSVRAGSKTADLGVDSGRIWAMMAEFEIEVEIDSGLSGYLVVKDTPVEEIELLSQENY